jgi:hypothetical protein
VWSTLSESPDVAKYEHIPADKYDDCVSFIRRMYEKLTGESISGEQLRFPNIDE